MPRIDAARLLKDLRDLARIGAWKTGVHRPTYSADDMTARHWLATRLTEAGLTPEIDGIGNVIGRTSAAVPKLLLGSHLETQPHAGWLDGAMGVIYGLEVARTLGPTLGQQIEVGAWADEEGHFGNFLGSRSFVRGIDGTEIAATVNRHNGEKLADALAHAGLADRPRAKLDPARYRGYLEAHIEQGDELDSSGLRLGVVTSIVSISAIPDRVGGRAAPRGRPAQGRPQGRRRGARAPGGRDRGALPPGRRSAQRVDHRAHPAGAGRGQHRARRRGNAVSVP